jgi:hypothetical protein
LSSTAGAMPASATRPSRGSGRLSGSTSSKRVAGLRRAAATTSWMRSRGSPAPKTASSWTPWFWGGGQGFTREGGGQSGTSTGGLGDPLTLWVIREIAGLPSCAEVLGVRRR